MNVQNVEIEKIKKLLIEAEKELDSAVEHGCREQEMYWLGRKEAYKELLNISTVQEIR